MSLRRSPEQRPAEQREVQTFVVPDLSIKDLLSAIPAHCFKRSAIRSGSYVLWDFFLLGVIYYTASTIDTIISPSNIDYPNPLFYKAARFALWTAYGWAAGLVATGLWVIAHECGHQAFSESKAINNTVGWILHSALGVPYHSWRVSHAKHHASTGHMNLDQVFVPRTRSQLGLPPLDPEKEDPQGINVSDEIQKELWEAIGDSPLSAATVAAFQLLLGWPLYLIRNASGQKSSAWAGVNHFIPKAPLFSPHHHWQVYVSDVGILIWIAALATWSYTRGVNEMLSIYFVPYLWVNHWLVLITFLQHSSPFLPHYRAPEFTFPRGALATLDRNLLGGAGRFWGWVGETATHGISETHVLHHVSSKIPHYHAWEATYALRKRLESAGIRLIGAPGGWTEVYKVVRECKFVEDDGNVVFYKNARGLAACKPVFGADGGISDSGVDVQ